MRRQPSGSSSGSGTGSGTGSGSAVGSAAGRSNSRSNSRSCSNSRSNRRSRSNSNSRSLPLGLSLSLPLCRHADCWHVGGTNHGCFLRFDLGGTPRLTGVSTPMVQPGGLLRLTGHGIDGGLKGVAMVEGRLQQDASGTILGCFSRDEDQNGDTAVALSHSDDTSFSCWLEPPGAVTASGFFNVTVDVHRDKRGEAYHQWQRSVDVAAATLYDVEMAPRLTAVSPQLGSLAGGTELTIQGAGFGGDAAALSVSVGGTPCKVSALTPTSIYCRVDFRQQVPPPSRSAPPPPLPCALSALHCHPTIPPSARRPSRPSPSLRPRSVAHDGVRRTGRSCA